MARTSGARMQSARCSVGVWGLRLLLTSFAAVVQWNCAGGYMAWMGHRDIYVDVGEPNVLLGCAQGVRLGGGHEELLYHLK